MKFFCSRKSDKKQSYKKAATARPQLRFERLEPKEMLRTTVFLDFGAGIGYANNLPQALQTTNLQILSVAG
jgi:hypothetical protein